MENVENIPLYEEFRLIERGENEINGAWRGAHLLLFFLAFVFGSFCTFCFHMLMYLFEEKCVLFPKLLLPSETRHNYLDYLPDKEPDNNEIPVDFVTTKWKDKSTCYLPTYVPLLSGVCGLVWTAMFLMCSSGNQTLTGLQRSWRILPPIFIFSLALGSLCVYSSAVTQAGLMDLCDKLSEVTGGMDTCSFQINVVTLVFEKRIRGVYQAIRLTIISAWLHTTCWLLAALLAVLRVLLVVDFRLVRIKAELRGNLEQIMELNETQVRTVSPDIFEENEYLNVQSPLKNRHDSQGSNTPNNDFYYVSQLAQADSDMTIHDIYSSTSVIPISSQTALRREPKHIRTDLAEKSISPVPTTSKGPNVKDYTSLSHSSSRSEKLRYKNRKSNLKHRSVQTDPEKRSPDAKPKVKIADTPIKANDDKVSEETLVPSKLTEDQKETQDLDQVQLKYISSSSELLTSSSESETELPEDKDQVHEDNKYMYGKKNKQLQIINLPDHEDKLQLQPVSKDSLKLNQIQLRIKEKYPSTETIYPKDEEIKQPEIIEDEIVVENPDHSEIITRIDDHNYRQEEDKASDHTIIQNVQKVDIKEPHTRGRYNKVEGKINMQEDEIATTSGHPDNIQTPKKTTKQVEKEENTVHSNTSMLIELYNRRDTLQTIQQLKRVEEKLEQHTEDSKQAEEQPGQSKLDTENDDTKRRKSKDKKKEKEKTD